MIRKVKVYDKEFKLLGEFSGNQLCGFNSEAEVEKYIKNHFPSAKQYTITIMNTYNKIFNDSDNSQGWTTERL